MKQIVKKRLQRVLSLTVVAALFGLLAGFISMQIDDANRHDTISISFVASAIASILGFTFGLMEEFVWQGLSKKMNFYSLTAIQFLSYLTLIIFWLIIGITTEHMLNDHMSFSEALSYYIYEENFIRDIILSGLLTIIFIIIGKLRQLHSLSELSNLVLGKYYYPEEEIRIIMFADLANSTATAERLGSVQFSSYLQDCYTDLSEAILAWGGKVYQYLGDGIVVSWRSKSSEDHRAAINCFFDMQDILVGHKNYYQKHYQTHPRIRAGIHKGKVITTWVGEQHKELAFHGDAINTASRIQGLCKEYNTHCLVSSSMLEGYKQPDHIQQISIGEVMPRGKSQAISLYALESKN